MRGTSTKEHVGPEANVHIRSSGGRCTSSDAISCFKHHHRISCGGHLKRSRETAEARTDHDDAPHATMLVATGMGLPHPWGALMRSSGLPRCMGKASRLPHDRGHLLWTSDGGATKRLLASVDRWVTTMLADDGIDAPVMEGGPTSSASIVAKSDGLIAGTAAVDHLLQIWAMDVRVDWAAGDGRNIASGGTVGTLRGSAASMLRIERTVLNLLGHLSGIATATSRWAHLAPGQIACTRKTTYGLLDKWAVHLGGGLTHRLDRGDALMLKENDLASYGKDELEQVHNALSNLRVEPEHAFVEIEVRSERQAISAALAWSSREDLKATLPFVIMLDNLPPETCREVANQLKGIGQREHVVLEASGGIRLEDLRDWKESGMDVLSTSAVNRGAEPLDLSMLMDGT
jgi:nicotinate-nucleotide pyrophosphorylase (carboxylating)